MGETNEQALKRELDEEIGADAIIGARLWTNQTPTGIQLTWFEAKLVDERAPLTADPAEVESIHWLRLAELRMQPNLLSTNHEFLEALDRGDFQISSNLE